MRMGAAREDRDMSALIRNWWMMAVRGMLAAVFGLGILAWPRISLWTIVVIFGVYAMLDGIWALASVVRACRRRYEGWPVALEGLAGVAFGFLALAWPFLPRELVYLLGAWGVVTGVLEIIAAAWLPEVAPMHWLLGTAGAFSLFLGGVILMLPHTDASLIARLVGAYGVAFGIVITVVAVGFHQAYRIGPDRPAPRASAERPPMAVR
jgi:uncharacterized membrane protein HdeD (DUF308 family)